MRIHANFTGGNILVEKVENDFVFLEREIRDTEGDWFYWAFCVEEAAGMTLTFRFPYDARVGRFGPAVSHDLKNWHWLDVPSWGDSFTYTFGPGENKVFFAHNMLYHPERFLDFCMNKELPVETVCPSVKGRDLPGTRFGSGDKWILLTARHHACESTGSYVLEGVLDTLLPVLPEEYSVLVIPFVDYDGVVDGDQGKNRKPHDHNRDYTDEPIYAVVDYMMQFGRKNNLMYTFDFHSPWHQGSQNDHVFLSRSTEAMEPFTDHFAEFFKKETADIVLHYDRIHDVGPNEQWNDENSPNSKNYFSKQSSVKLSVTLETPYFGLAETKISQSNMLELGEAFGRAILCYITENP
ncbi:MAG: hypothetical protein E7631_09655 [Ruminococcaceae bacterium]|nr:hypothetical protein [Oscillospiraceae bacterium]